MDFYCRTFLVSFPSSPLTRRGLTHTFTTLLLLLAAPFQVVLFGASTIPSSFDREKLYLCRFVPRVNPSVPCNVYLRIDNHSVLLIMNTPCPAPHIRDVCIQWAIG